MLRGKAIQFRQGTPTRFRDVQLASTDRNGKLADVTLGFDEPGKYFGPHPFFGSIAGMNSSIAP